LSVLLQIKSNNTTKISCLVSTVHGFLPVVIVGEAL